MSLLEKAVEALSKIDDFKSLAEGINDFLNAENAIDKAAALAKVTAEVAVGIAVAGSLRVAFSGLRLGLAVSGRIGEWEALSKVLGVGSGTGVGSLIDWINDQHYGSDLYDWLHPDPVTNTAWQTAKTPPRRDPLAIDLDGDGIETIGVPTGGSPILFDHDADGVRTGTGWVKPDDAWLVLDRNGNGTIDSGAELFGVDTMITVTEPVMPGSSTMQTVTRKATSGFEALKTLDANGDGVFNAGDAAFNQVQLWQDLNQDGVSQGNELFTLAAKGIASIALNPSTTSTNLGNGNTVTGQASVTRTNGSTTQIDSVELQASNLNLADNPFYREFTDAIPMTTQAQALPEMGGSGWTRDLREAMSLGTPEAAQLAQLVSTFAATETRDGQRAQLDALIDAWARTTGRLDTSTRRTVVGTVVSSTSTTQTTRYTTADPIDVQAGSVQSLGIATFGLPGGYYESQSGAGVTFSVLSSRGSEVLRRLSELEVFNAQRFVSFTQTVTTGPLGTGSGGGGGGGGGGASSGTQTFAINLAQVQVDSLNAAYGALSESVYGALVVQTRLRPYLDAVDLVIDDNGLHFDTAALTAKLDAFKSLDERNAMLDLVDLNRYTSSTLQAVGFDGTAKLRAWVDALPLSSTLRTELTGLDVLTGVSTAGSARADIFLGDGAANAFSAGSGDDLVDGGAGNDQLYGGEGADTLIGREGNDSLFGDAGNDMMDGGAGNDNLYGGAGADTYLFGRGSGQDLISNYDGDAVGTNTDTIQLVGGLTAADVTLTRSSDDLIISINGSRDSLRVSNYFNTDGATAYVVENISFGDGTTWNVATVKANVLVPTAGNDTLTGYASNDAISGADGNDNLSGKAGDDVLDGGTGADYLYGGDGNDSLTGGAGADYLGGEVGNDTLDGGAGNDSLSGGTGADTYLFGKGSGQDTISNYDGEAVGTNADTILLGAEIAPAGVTLTRSYDDLIVAVNGTDDSLRVSSYFNNDGAASYVVENIKFTDGTNWDVATVKAKALIGSAGNDTLTGYASNDTINGGDGNDNLSGKVGDDVIDGGAGADYLYGGDGNDTLEGGAGADNLSSDAGNDTLDGGAGSDVLSGGTGADTYLFGKGSGQDTINNYDGEAIGTNADTILLGAGIAATGVTLTRSYSDLVIGINGTDDSLRVSGYFNSDGATSSVAGYVKFADGTSWDVATIKAKTLIGTVGNDTLTGYAAGDTINGGDGSDTLSGQAGDDVVDGGTGADYLYGGDGNDNLKGDTGADYLTGDVGNDLLDGGAGNDNLNGGTGADTYLFGKGSGQDTISNYDGEAVGTNADTILLGAGIASTGVTLTRAYDDLIIGINGTDDTLRVSTYFNSDGAAGYVVENIKFADGSNWDVATVKAKTLVGTAGNDALVGYATNDTISGSDGNDTVSGRAGDDLLDGGAGADYLYGGDGNDNLKGGTGADYLGGDAGNDTLDGGAGSDNLSGGFGADTYLFGKGSGQDTISNYDGEAVGTNADTILLGAGIATTGVTLTRSNDDLIIGINGTDDSVRVTSYFNSDGASSYVVENIKFADGTNWNYATAKSKVSTAAPPSALNVPGTSGNDSLVGGAGNDTLSGQAGNDTLDGGAGNDALDGGAGNDTYLFNIGSGKDTISSYDVTAGKLDVIQLGTGIATSAVTPTREGDTLVLTLNGTSDVLRVNSYFSGDGTSAYKIEQIKFADGTIWDIAALKSKVATGSAGDDTLIGYATADTLSGLDGTDVLWGRAGNDTLDGGAGQDQLNGEDGDDVLRGGSQNDVLSGGTGNDTLDGGAGDDALDGGAGNDTYLFGSGSGKDTISSYDTTVGKVDIIELGAGITNSGVTLTRESDTLVLTLNGSSDALRVNSYFSSDGTTPYKVEQIKFADGTTWDVSAVKTKVATGSSSDDVLTGYATADSLSGADGTDVLWGRAGNDTLDGGAGQDQVNGEDGDDSLFGGAQNDTLSGGAGNDTLDGGAGDDSLDGGAGNDTYVFNIGSGKDMISSYDPTVGKVDTIQLGAGIAPSGVTLSRESDTLVLTINGSSDALKVNGYFSGDGTSPYKIEQIKFADGTMWDVVAVKAKVATGSMGDETLIGYATGDNLAGLDGADVLWGRAGNDTLDGGAGSDQLNGEDGDDVLRGGAQSDALNGGAGNDTLDGGDGDDTLDGGAGNDTYLFGTGSGKDTISSYDTTVGKVDTIQFGTGITTSSVTLARESDTLVMTLTGTSDVLRVSNYFTTDATTPYKVEQIKFADGTAWDVATVKAKVTAGSTGGDALTGYATADTLSGLDGADVLWGRAGNDTLDGGAGQDQLNGEDGDDSLLGGSQNDTLSGGNGNDTLDGGAGDDALDGGAGNDTYVFGIGSGKDTISSYDTTAGKVDTIQLGAGITTSGVTLTRESDVLVLALNSSSDTLRVSNYFTSDATSPFKVEQIKFADGTIWSVAQVKAAVLRGTIGDDMITGFTGSDTLDGGAGQDTLAGMAGSDTYIFGRGYGADVIQEFDGAAGNTDVMQFMAGVTSDQLWFRQVGSDLEVSIVGTTDKATLQNWYAGTQYHVEQFKTSDGKTLLDSKVQGLVSAMAAFAPPAVGQTTLPTNYQTTLAPTIAANWGP